MTTRIGLVSDVHASLDALAEALRIFRQQGCDLVLCAGDIAGYFTDLSQCIDQLQQYAAYYHPEFIGATADQADID